MQSRLTLSQRRRLANIDRKSKSMSGKDAFWNNATDKSLLKRGLIERCDETKILGPGMSFTTFLCRITGAGRELSAALAKEGK